MQVVRNIWSKLIQHRRVTAASSLGAVLIVAFTVATLHHNATAADAVASTIDHSHATALTNPHAQSNAKATTTTASTTHAATAANASSVSTSPTTNNTAPKSVSKPVAAAPTIVSATASTSNASPSTIDTTKPNRSAAPSACDLNMNTYYTQHTSAINSEYKIHKANLAAINSAYYDDPDDRADDLDDETDRWNGATHDIDVIYKNQLISVGCSPSLYSFIQ